MVPCLQLYEPSQLKTKNQIPASELIKCETWTYSSSCTKYKKINKNKTRLHIHWIMLIFFCNVYFLIQFHFFFSLDFIYLTLCFPFFHLYFIFAVNLIISEVFFNFFFCEWKNLRAKFYLILFGICTINIHIFIQLFAFETFRNAFLSLFNFLAH